MQIQSVDTDRSNLTINHGHYLKFGVCFSAQVKALTLSKRKHSPRGVIK